MGKRGRFETGSQGSYMDEALPSYLVFEKQLRWLLVFVVIMGLTAFFLNKKQTNIRPAVNKTVTVKIIRPPASAKSLSKIEPEHSLKSVAGKKAKHRLHPLILQAANRYEIDPALVNAIIMAESGYNHMAISKRGARGLMQLMPATAEALGVEDSFNPEQNIDGGVRYFKQLVNQFDGNLKLALAAYNAGSKNVRLYQGIPPFKATHFYIKKVFKYYRIYKEQSDGGMDRA